MYELSRKLCDKAEKIDQKSIDHKKEYVIDLTDDQIIQLNIVQEQALYTEKENEWQENIRMEYGQHIKSCEHERCKHILTIWKGNQNYSCYTA